jgi:hypothetical protein
MQTLRHDISLATYILIALHFIRLSIHRATPEVLHGDTDIAIPAGKFYSKLIFFFYSNDELQAMEFYTNTTEEASNFYNAVIKEFKENSCSIFCVPAYMDLKEELCHNEVLSSSLNILKKYSPHLSVVERNRVRQKIAGIALGIVDKFAYSTSVKTVKIC